MTILYAKMLYNSGQGKFMESEKHSWEKVDAGSQKRSFTADKQNFLACFLCMQYRSIYLSAEFLFSRFLNNWLIPLQLETLGCFRKKLHKKINFPLKSVRRGKKLGNTSFLDPGTCSIFLGWISKWLDFKFSWHKISFNIHLNLFVARLYLYNANQFVM